MKDDSAIKTSTTRRPGQTGVSGQATKATKSSKPGQSNDPAPPVSRGLSSLGRGEEPFFDERNDVLSVVSELEDQLDRYQEIRESLERDLAGRADDLQAAQQRTQELEWQTVTLQTRIEALEQVKQEATLLEEELAETQRKAQHAADELAAVQQDNQRLAGEVKNANKQLESLWQIRKERDGLLKDVKVFEGKIATLKREQQDLTENTSVLHERLREAELNFDESRKLREQAEVDLRTAEDRSNELQRVQEELIDKIDSLRTDKKALQTNVLHLERENNRLTEQRRFLETEIMSLRNMNRSAEAALGNVKKAFSEVRVALSETKARVRRRTVGVRSRTLDAIDAAIDPELVTASFETSTVVKDDAVQRGDAPASNEPAADASSPGTEDRDDA